MQENKDSDNTVPGDRRQFTTTQFAPITLDDLWKMVQESNNRISILEHRASFTATAFPKNDLGKPDYDGHRKQHLQIEKDEKLVEGYQIDATKKVIGGGVLFIFGLFATGALDWIKAHMR